MISTVKSTLVPAGTWTVDPTPRPSASRSSTSASPPCAASSTSSRARSDRRERRIGARLHGTVKAVSVNTNDSGRDEHLHQATSSASSRPGALRFESTGIEQLGEDGFQIAGDLAMTASRSRSHAAEAEIQAHRDRPVEGSEARALEVTDHCPRRLGYDLRPGAREWHACLVGEKVKSSWTSRPSAGTNASLRWWAREVVRGLLGELMDSTGARAGYADARFVPFKGRAALGPQRPPRPTRLARERGIRIRVQVGGAWGFAAVRGTERADGKAGAGARALAITEARPRVLGRRATGARPQRAASGPAASRATRWGPARGEAPRCCSPPMLGWVPSRAADADSGALRGASARRTILSPAQRERSVIACGRRGGGIRAVAVGGADSQVRSCPASHSGHVAEAGYEHFLKLEFTGCTHLAIADEGGRAFLCLRAACTTLTTLVLGDGSLELQVHRVPSDPLGVWSWDQVLGWGGVLRGHELRASGLHSRLAQLPGPEPG